MLIITFLATSRSQPQKLPNEGAWNLVYAKHVRDSITYEFPLNSTGSEVFIWTKDYFAFTGMFKADSITMYVDEGGTYTLMGNKYEQTLNYFSNSDPGGKKMNGLLDIKNDTLTLIFPVDGNWKIDGLILNLKKYVRLN